MINRKDQVGLSDTGGGGWCIGCGKSWDYCDCPGPQPDERRGVLR